MEEGDGVIDRLSDTERETNRGRERQEINTYMHAYRKEIDKTN